MFVLVRLKPFRPTRTISGLRDIGWEGSHPGKNGRRPGENALQAAGLRREPSRARRDWDAFLQPAAATNLRGTVGTNPVDDDHQVRISESVGDGDNIWRVQKDRRGSVVGLKRVLRHGSDAKSYNVTI